MKGFFTFIAVAAVVWTIPLGRGVAIPEILSALFASVWSIVLGFKMLKEAAIKTISQFLEFVKTC